MHKRHQPRTPLQQPIERVQIQEPVGKTGTYASSASRSWHSSCQGTMFEWCSISVSTTRSPR